MSGLEDAMFVLTAAHIGIKNVTVGDVELQKLVLCCCICYGSEQSQELVLSLFEVMVLPCCGSFIQVFGQVNFLACVPRKLNGHLLSMRLVKSQPLPSA